MGSIAILGSENNRLGRLTRLLPGETFDVLIRTLSLTTMYFCYRNDKEARRKAYAVWIICIVLLFCRTVFRIVMLDLEETRQVNVMKAMIELKAE